MTEDLTIRPFRVHFNVWVDCVGFERLEDETEDEARAALIKEICEGFRQTAYDLTWEIEASGSIDPMWTDAERESLQVKP